MTVRKWVAYEHNPEFRQILALAIPDTMYVRSEAPERYYPIIHVIAAFPTEVISAACDYYIAMDDKHTLNFVNRCFQVKVALEYKRDKP